MRRAYLEAVEVEEEHRGDTLGAVGVGDRMFKPVLEQAAVRQSRPRIVAAQVFRPHFAFLAFGDIDGEAQQRRLPALQLDP